MIKKIIILFLVVIICGCGKYHLTNDDFISIAAFEGYIVEENMQGYESYQYIKKIYYAINREDAYYVQYFEMIDAEYAKKFFEINKVELENIVSDNTYVKRINRSTYSLYHLENDEDYMLVLQCEDKVIYVVAPIEYINEIEDFLYHLGLDFI